VVVNDTVRAALLELLGQQPWATPGLLAHLDHEGRITFALEGDTYICDIDIPGEGVVRVPGGVCAHHLEDS
jgi:hypothetical protein